LKPAWGKGTNNNAKERRSWGTAWDLVLDSDVEDDEELETGDAFAWNDKTHWNFVSRDEGREKETKRETGDTPSTFDKKGGFKDFWSNFKDMFRGVDAQIEARKAKMTTKGREALDARASELVGQQTRDYGNHDRDFDEDAAETD